MHDSAPDERVGWRFATSADIDAYYGERPHQTIRALVFTLNDEVAGVVGVARHTDHVRFFGEFVEEFRPHLRSITSMRAIKQAQTFIHESRLPVLAVADETEPDAIRFLTRFGFEHYQENIFRWPNSPYSSHT